MCICLVCTVCMYVYMFVCMYVYAVQEEFKYMYVCIHVGESLSLQEDRRGDENLD